MPLSMLTDILCVFVFGKGIYICMYVCVCVGVGVITEVTVLTHTLLI